APAPPPPPTRYLPTLVPPPHPPPPPARPPPPFSPVGRRDWRQRWPSPLPSGRGRPSEAEGG
ncbi:hypothetical protein, partial [Mesorhizobium ciceri]|uniref:hypothetical protein n=1 Tax=Mesorhizobium ciceri TaxID=39645 RepID=UPI00344DF7CC